MAVLGVLGSFVGAMPACTLGGAQCARVLDRDAPVEGSLLLDGWTGNIAIGAVDAAVTLLWFHLVTAAFTRIEVLAGIDRHRFD